MIGAVNIQFNLDDYYIRIQNMLPPDSILKAEKYHFTEDKKRSVAGEFLKRVLLANVLGTRASLLEFKTNPFNKPLLSSHEGVHFNLTHSGDWVLIATDENPLGIDIEKIEPEIPNVEEIVFTSEEIRQIYQYGSKESVHRFYNHWTRKESYIKALGVGFSASLEKITIRELPGGNIQIVSDHYDSRWIIKDLLLDEGYSLSLCSRKTIANTILRLHFSELLDRFE